MEDTRLTERFGLEGSPKPTQPPTRCRGQGCPLPAPVPSARPPLRKRDLPNAHAPPPPQPPLPAALHHPLYALTAHNAARRKYARQRLTVARGWGEAVGCPGPSHASPRRPRCDGSRWGAAACRAFRPPLSRDSLCRRSAVSPPAAAFAFSNWLRRLPVKARRRFRPIGSEWGRSRVLVRGEAGAGPCGRHVSGAGRGECGGVAVTPTLTPRPSCPVRFLPRDGVVGSLLVAGDWRDRWAGQAWGHYPALLVLFTVFFAKKIKAVVDWNQTQRFVGVRCWALWPTFQCRLLAEILSDASGQPQEVTWTAWCWPVSLAGAKSGWEGL